MKLSSSLLQLLKNKLLLSTFVYTLSTAFGALVAFLLLPILTKYLSQRDYGIVETFTAVSACLAGIVLMGGQDLVAKEFFKLNSNDLKKRIGEQINVFWLGGIILIILLIIINKYTNVTKNIIKLDSGLVLLAVGVSVANAAASLQNTIFQLQKRMIHYSIFVNSKTLMNMIASIILIVVVGYAWEGRIIGIAGSSFLFLIVTLIILKRNGVLFSYPTKNTLILVAAGFPLMLAHITAWAMEMIDKIMINNFIGLEGTGLYSVGYRFGMIVMMIELSFSRAWLPFFYEKIQSAEKNDKISIVKATYFYIIVLLIISLIIGIGGKYLLYLMVDETYYKADRFIFLISMSYFFDGIWKVFIVYLVHLNKVNIYSFIVGLSAIINILLNYVLLPKIGLIGAAWATFISFAFGTITTIIIAMRLYRMPWIQVFRKML